MQLINVLAFNLQLCGRTSILLKLRILLTVSSKVELLMCADFQESDLKSKKCNLDVNNLQRNNDLLTLNL